VPLYRRAALRTGDILLGPSIVAELTSTTVIEPGWEGRVSKSGDLILTRGRRREGRESVSGGVDPVMLEVFNNLFMSVAEQMGATLANTAWSVNIKERLDFSCAVFDKEGRLVANAPHLPVHLGSMGESVRAVIEANEVGIRSGRVWMLNAPYNGGTHLPDVTVVAPVFDADVNADTGAGSGAGELLFFVAARGHHADIGGKTPGSAPPDSVHIEEEGVVIDNFLLVDEGRLREEETFSLLRSGRWPCRNPQQNLADLRAQVAACETGGRELHRMVSHFGREAVFSYMGYVQENAEESVRRAISRLRDGSFEYPLDNGTWIRVSIRVDRDLREATIDFSGTSEQSASNYNAPLPVCRAAVLYVFRTLVEDEIPLNEGCLKPLRLLVPRRSILSCEYPAAVIAGNTEVSQMVTDALYGALGVLSASQGTMNNFVWGDDEIQNYETICGGTGAGIDHEGCDAVHSHMTNTRMTDAEVLEQRFPVRLESFLIRRGSGGLGAYRGGDGVIRRLRFLRGMTVTTLSSHRVFAPHGLAGGGEGARGRNVVERVDGTEEELGGNAQTEVCAGDIFRMETPGGGAYGRRAAAGLSGL
ncbi:MAG: hydantoinase B/oxoprolinase family protein, partial [Alphaproteobacteria bacterium]